MNAVSVIVAVLLAAIAFGSSLPGSAVVGGPGGIVPGYVGGGPGAPVSPASYVGGGPG